MSDIFVLDSGPLGELIGPRGRPRTESARFRLATLEAVAAIIVPEVADYEIRREMLRRGAVQAIRRLDDLRERCVYDPITTAVMHRAADFWALLRRGGRPTADPHALDADAILAAQAMQLEAPGDRVIVLTTNERHLSRLVETRDWASLA